MSQLTNRYLRIFLVCFYIILFAFSLLLLFGNLLALITPDLDLPFIATGISKQILNFLCACAFVILSVDCLASENLNPNSKLGNITTIILIVAIFVVDPILEISKELIEGEDFFYIFNKRPDITGSIAVLLLFLIVWLSITIDKKIHYK